MATPDSHKTEDDEANFTFSSEKDVLTAPGVAEAIEAAFEEIREADDADA